MDGYYSTGSGQKAMVRKSAAMLDSKSLKISPFGRDGSKRIVYRKKLKALIQNPQSKIQNCYSSRSAVTTGMRAARMAGGRPPTRPMVRANSMPMPISRGVISKAKAMFENVCQLIVEVE